MIKDQDRPQESLAQAVGAVLKRQLVAFLVIWLAIGFPVACQMHGTMSIYELESHDHFDTASNSEYPCAVHAHTTAPSMTMLLSLVISLTPAQLASYKHFSFETLKSSPVRWPLQLANRPPERPPRSM